MITVVEGSNDQVSAKIKGGASNGRYIHVVGRQAWDTGVESISNMEAEQFAEIQRHCSIRGWRTKICITVLHFPRNATQFLSLWELFYLSSWARESARNTCA